MLSALKNARGITKYSPYVNTMRNFRAPYVNQNHSHWFINVPDVKEGDLKVEVKDQNMKLSWTDYKTLRKGGRLYESRKSFEEVLGIPEGVSEEDVKAEFKNNGAIVSIAKPQKKLTITDPNEGTTLMKMNIPEGGDDNLDVRVEGKNLIVKYESTNQKEGTSGYSQSLTRIQRTIPIPKDVDPSRIDTKIENGKLIVSVRPLLEEANNTKKLKADSESGSESESVYSKE